MRKRLFCFTIISLIVMHVFLPINSLANNITVSAHNAILMDQSNGDVLYEKNIHEKEEIASITKIMTAIIAIESGQMNEKTTTSRRAINTEGSAIYLEQGEKMTINDLVYGLMLRSGNDAAIAISEHIGGSVEGFVYLMNEKARWLGMTNTNFSNPHGLSEKDHYSTAFDMAILMKHAMENKTFKKITGTKSFTAETRTYAWQNKNKLLTVYDDRCTGGKTGFTKSAGRTLVTTASEKDRDLIAVTLNAPDDWQDHTTLYNHGFSLSTNTMSTAVKSSRGDFLNFFMKTLKGISGAGYSD